MKLTFDKFVVSLFILGVSFKSISYETDLELFLKKYIGRKVAYIPNPGNAGDAFIWYGTICLLDKIGLKYITSYNEKFLLSSDIVLFGGGGNLVPYYNDCADFIKRYMRRVNQLIILPHTIQGHEDLLKNLTPNVILFCRDLLSFNYCKKIVPFPENIFLSKDLAFYANVEKYKKIGLKSKGNLFALRTDRERHSASVKLPHANRDISVLGGIKATTTFEVNLKVLDNFLSTIAQVKTVWTDRLHIGIAGFLLDKEVHLFDNTYGKNKSVYDTTIRSLDLEKKVQFHGTNFDILIEGNRQKSNQ